MDRRRFVDPRQINSSVDELHGPLAHINLFQGHEVGLEYGENAGEIGRDLVQAAMSDSLGAAGAPSTLMQAGNPVENPVFEGQQEQPMHIAFPAQNKKQRRSKNKFDKLVASFPCDAGAHITPTKAGRVSSQFISPARALAPALLRALACTLSPACI